MNKNQERVLKELFNKPTYKFHIRELARVTKLNPNTIINIANSLEKQGIIKKEAKKHLVEISLNFENRKVQWKKRLFNLAQVYDSGVIDFLGRIYLPSFISLIGSYSRGEDMEKSDIDLVIATSKKESIDLRKFEKLLNRKIHLIIARTNDMSEEFFNNLINGVVLYGAIRK